MEPLLSPEQMREMDRLAIQDLGIPELILMEHAAIALVQALERRFSKLLPETTGLIVAGSGNNGGDVLAAARILHQRGVKRLFIVALGETRSSSCDQQIKILGHLGLAFSRVVTDEFVNSCDWVLDGIFGTGLSRTVEGPEAIAIQRINKLRGKKWIVSADIPSGLSGQTGQPMGVAVHASETIALGFYKKGHVTGSASEYVGRLGLASVEIPRDVPFPVDAFLYGPADAKRLPMRRRAGHKGTFGHVVVRAGEKQGASELAVIGALRSGAGLVTFLHDGSRPRSPAVPPEAIQEPYSGTYSKYEKAVIVFGPGLGTAAKNREELAELLKGKSPLVLDADAVTMLAEMKSPKGECDFVLTPHPKEAARLLACTVEEIEKDRYEAVRRLSDKFHCAVLLKGKGTLVTYPTGPIMAIVSGDTGLAKGGAGDLLSGIIASMLAQGLEMAYAVPLAVYVHGRASEILSQRLGTERASQPSDIAHALAEVFRELESCE